MMDVNTTGHERWARSVRRSRDRPGKVFVGRCFLLEVEYCGLQGAVRAMVGSARSCTGLKV